jgi:hypothetical protein
LSWEPVHAIKDLTKAVEQIVAEIKPFDAADFQAKEIRDRASQTGDSEPEEPSARRRVADIKKARTIQLFRQVAVNLVDRFLVSAPIPRVFL